MASAKQFPGCKTWTACFKVFTGGFTAKGRPKFEYKQQATGFREREQALAIAGAFERAAKDAALTKWNQARARAFLQEMSALTGTSASAPQGTKMFIEDWLERMKRDPDKGNSTRANYRCIAADFYAFLGERVTSPIHQISREDVVLFRDSEMEAGKSVATINKAMSMLRGVFQSAVERGAASENPLTAGGKVTLKKSRKSKQKRSAFTIEQFRDLVRVAASGAAGIHQEWHTFILLVGYTAGRQQEPAKLRWSSVDLVREVLVLTRGKNHDELVLPIHPALLRHLKALNPSAGRDAYIMPEIACRTVQDLSKTFREDVLPLIGIVQPYDTRKNNPDKGKGRKVAAYGIHSLRHSLNTWLDAEGVPTATRMAISGHYDSDVSLSYTHPEFATLRNALARVASVA